MGTAPGDRNGRRAAASFGAVGGVAARDRSLSVARTSSEVLERRSNAPVSRASMGAGGRTPRPSWMRAARHTPSCSAHTQRSHPSRSSRRRRNARARFHLLAPAPPRGRVGDCARRRRSGRTATDSSPMTLVRAVATEGWGNQSRGRKIGTHRYGQLADDSRASSRHGGMGNQSRGRIHVRAPASNDRRCACGAASRREPPLPRDALGTLRRLSASMGHERGALGPARTASARLPRDRPVDRTGISELVAT